MSVTPSEAEERYFAQQEAQRRKDKRRAMEAAAQEMSERRAMKEALHTDDDAITAAIRDLGFDGDTARVFDVLPLVHVAWADGSVSNRERATIFEVLDQRGVAADDEGGVLIASLLEERPSDAFLDETLALLKAITSRAGLTPMNIVELCESVAEASGGILGLGNKISGDERATIEKIAGALGAPAFDEFKRKLG